MKKILKYLLLAVVLMCTIGTNLSIPKSVKKQIICSSFFSEHTKYIAIDHVMDVLDFCDESLSDDDDDDLSTLKNKISIGGNAGSLVQKYPHFISFNSRYKKCCFKRSAIPNYFSIQGTFRVLRI